MEKRETQKQIVIWFPLWLTITFSGAVYADCNEYYVVPNQEPKAARLTTICNSNGSVQITNIELKESEHDKNGQGENNEHEGEINKPENDHSDFRKPSSATSKVALGSGDQYSDSIEEYRTGNANERIKYIAISSWKWLSSKIPRRFTDWFVEHWDALGALILGYLAVRYARRAWWAAREDVAESKQANLLQLKAYFIVSDAMSMVVSGDEEGEIDFEHVDLSEEEMDVLFEGNGAIDDDEVTDILRDMNAEQIDPHNMIHLLIRFKLTNKGETPAWNIQAFTIYDFSLTMFGVELPPVFGGRPIIEDQTDYLGAGDSMTVYILCTAFGIPGAILNPDPSAIAESIEFTFSAESSLDDIETMNSENVTRQLSVIGSNGAPETGNMAFDYPDLLGERLRNNIEDGYLPLTSIRISSDKTGEKKNRFTTQNYKTYTPYAGEDSGTAWVKKDGPEGYKPPDLPWYKKLFI